MAGIKEIYDYLCELAPLELKMDFDNVGFLTGHLDGEAQRILLALDITDAVIDEAMDLDAQVIVSHHPLIFSPLRSVTDCGAGRKTMRLVENRLAAICMHTNLDIADGGVNDVLMHTLGAAVAAPLDTDGCGRIGLLPEEMPLTAFLERCRTRLNAPGLRYVDAGKPVHKLAVMGGSGGKSLYRAAELGCDTYVTADISYHSFLDALELGLNLIDADHFCTENPMIPVLAQKLRERFPDCEVLISQRHRPLIAFYTQV